MYLIPLDLSDHSWSLTLPSSLTNDCPLVFTLQSFLASDSSDFLGLASPQVCEWGRLLCCCGRCHPTSSRGDFYYRLVVSGGNEAQARAYGRLAYGSEERVEGKEWLVIWGLLFLPSAVNSRLSPEIYLKRPAHSNDWRLDIMLKKKAVRSVARL